MLSIVGVNEPHVLSEDILSSFEVSLVSIGTIMSPHKVIKAEKHHKETENIWYTHLVIIQSEGGGGFFAIYWADLMYKGEKRRYKIAGFLRNY